MSDDDKDKKDKSEQKGKKEDHLAAIQKGVQLRKTAYSPKKNEKPVPESGSFGGMLGRMQEEMKDKVEKKAKEDEGWEDVEAPTTPKTPTTPVKKIEIKRAESPRSTVTTTSTPTTTVDQTATPSVDNTAPSEGGTAKLDPTFLRGALAGRRRVVEEDDEEVPKPKVESPKEKTIGKDEIKLRAAQLQQQKMQAAPPAQASQAEAEIPVAPEGDIPPAPDFDLDTGSVTSPSQSPSRSELGEKLSVQQQRFSEAKDVKDRQEVKETVANANANASAKTLKFSYSGPSFDETEVRAAFSELQDNKKNNLADLFKAKEFEKAYLKKRSWFRRIFTSKDPVRDKQIQKIEIALNLVQSRADKAGIKHLYDTLESVRKEISATEGVFDLKSTLKSICEDMIQKMDENPDFRAIHTSKEFDTLKPLNP